MFKQTDYITFMEKERRKKIFLIIMAFISVIAFITIPSVISARNNRRELESLEEEGLTVNPVTQNTELVGESRLLDTRSASPNVPPSWATILDQDEALYYDSSTGQLHLGNLNIISLDGNYTFDEYTVLYAASSLRSQVRTINDGLLDSISYGRARMTITCAAGTLAELVESEGSHYIQFTDPKTVYDTVIVLDVGHGGDDLGARIARPNFEKDFNLNIALHLLDIFENDNTLLIPTRTEDVNVSLEDRSLLANSIGDYFISIHNNVDEESDQTAGTVVFYNVPDPDNPLPAGLTNGEGIARVMVNALSSELETRNRGAQENSVYYVLNNTEIPAVLVELMFISNPAELARLMDPNGIIEIAEALAYAINQLPPAR